MPLITEIFKKKQRTFSFEVFPAKTPEGYVKLLKTIKSLCALKPDFISCTYGAGGGNRDKTLDVAEHIEKSFGIAAMAHLTCIAHTKKEIQDILEEISKRGINNVLAMRGDPPKENLRQLSEEEQFQYSCELVKFIRKRYKNQYAIGVAGFPEGHPLASDRDFDAKVLKEKIKAGAEFVITQLFFNNQDYFDYVNRLRSIGVNVRIIPGVLPITDYKGLVRFCNICKATITDEVHKIFKPIQNDPQKILEAGTAFAVRQCKDLLAEGAPGIHFYTLNKLHPVDTILGKIRPLNKGV